MFLMTRMLQRIKQTKMVKITRMMKITTMVLKAKLRIKMVLMTKVVKIMLTLRVVVHKTKMAIIRMATTNNNNKLWVALEPKCTKSTTKVIKVKNWLLP